MSNKFRYFRYIALLVTAHLALNACAQVQVGTEAPAQAATSAPAQTPIPCRQRSEICTQEFRPVCAARDNGLRCKTAPCPSLDYKTYPNACVACSDVKVEGYVLGSCESGNDGVAK